LQCFQLCQRGITIGKPKIFKIVGSKDCSKNECNTIRIARRRYKDPSSGANRPSDIAVTVNVNPEFSSEGNLNIKKKKISLGGMAQSEWTYSVRAVRDTQLADYSGPGVNRTRRVVYRPTIAVSVCLHVLMVSYCKRSLSRSGQL